MPTGPLTVKVTELVPANEYVCVRVVLKVFVVVPSPKSQNRLVIVPVEVSVKVTVNGLTPLVGLPVKEATGAIAPVPVTGLVLPPALLLLKVTRLVKLAVLAGAKLTTTLVQPNPARLNAVPETIVNGPVLTEAEALLKTAPPRFVTVTLS